MISKQEAVIIAHEHIEGLILQEECHSNKSCGTSYPLSWTFNIYHRNRDKDTFLTVIEITNKGVVARWDKKHISEETEDL